MIKARAKRPRTTPGAAPPHAFCSFCLKAPVDATRLVAGAGGVSICAGCVSLCSAHLSGTTQPRPDNPAVDTLPSAWLLELLQPLEATVRAKSSQIQWLVDALRARKVSWARIGKALNISRQSAWERFSRPARAAHPARLRLLPAVAVDPRAGEDRQ